MSVLEARDVRVFLGGRSVLDHVTASLRPGEVTAIVGPNGAGKSTLLSVLAGLRHPHDGGATLDDTSLTAMTEKARARRIGYLPQIADIAWPLEVRALVALGLTPYLGVRGANQADAGKVEAAMAAVGVQTLASRRVDTLSGGERARVLLARAMVGDPEWLLADEPLAGLDPAHALEVCTIFRQRADRGHGVALTLHDLTIASRLADRIIVLAEGTIIADGPPVEALTPQSLSQAYGVEARIAEGMGGALIEIVGLSASSN